MARCFPLTATHALTLVVLSSLCSLTTAADDIEPGFTSLFDGKTLTGWEGNLDTFRVEDGAIIGGTHKQRIPHNEFLCTKREYSNFELRLQAKLIGKGGNAGIQVRSKRIPNHHEVIGYQADMGVMGDGRLIWGNLYDESRRRKFLTEGDQAKLKRAIKLDDWNDFVIRCKGRHITITVNGLVVTDYTEKEDGIAESGIIGLQIHGGPPAEASYRNIRVRELK